MAFKFAFRSQDLIARSRIQTDSENSEFGNEIEIEFSDRRFLNPWGVNMSFRLLIRQVSIEDTYCRVVDTSAPTARSVWTEARKRCQCSPSSRARGRASYVGACVVLSRHVEPATVGATARTHRLRREKQQQQQQQQQQY
jgi:hypothetical protein